MDTPTEMDDIMKLKRFCFLGTFEPVYTHMRLPINVEKYFPIMEGILKKIKSQTMLPILRDLLNEETFVRRDEVLFVYATYLSGDIDIKCKTAMRLAFPILIKTEEDLFTFCKYSSLIGKYQKHKGFSRTVRKALTAWYEAQSADGLRNLWLAHRGLNGFTHKDLMKLCHISDNKLKSQEVAKPFFKTCKDIIKEAATEVEQEKKEGNESKTETQKGGTAQETTKPSNVLTPKESILKISELRTAKKNHDALKIIRKHKIPFHQVPGHFLQYPPILTQLLPSMTHFQVFKCWRRLALSRHLDNHKIFKICKSRLEDKEMARKLRMHPLHFLLNLRNIGIVNEVKKLPAKKVASFKMEYLNKLYLETFQWNMPSDNLRMHITINLQSNYKKKFLKNHRKLSYYEAVLALAFGYAKREAHVDVFHWYEDKVKLQKIVFEKNSPAELAYKSFDTIENPKNYQCLVTPIMNALTSDQCYDVFLCIVPSAARSNPKQSSEFLTKFLDKYRQIKNPNAKFIILNLLRFRRSMTYSETNNQNILEICGLDEHTPDLIHNFATRRFE